MIGLLSDHDVEFYVRLLWSQFDAGQWQIFGIDRFATFQDLQIDVRSSDREIWHYCQQHDLVLVTANRNMDDENSLEAVLRQLVQPDSLPVLTIVRPQRLANLSYREDCAYRIADIAIDLPRYRGTGRQFVP
jgi:hypothetical protein